MPTYQYACTDGRCGHKFELVQSFTDPAASECPTCSGPVRKVYSAVGVVFKGSGFYRTDSRADSRGGSGPKSSGSSSSGGGDKGSTDKGSTDKGSTDKGGSDPGGSAKSGDAKAAKSGSQSGSSGATAPSAASA